MADMEKKPPAADAAEMVQERINVRVTDIEGSGASFGEVQLTLVRYELEVDMEALAEAVRVWLLENVPTADTSTIIKTTVMQEKLYPKSK